MPEFDWDLFHSVPIIGILRGFESDVVPGIVQACVAGGLTTLEITMNSRGAAEQIRNVVTAAGGRLNVGAGTVTDLKLLEAALEAGASFVVTPSLRADVVRACLQQEVPVFPGVLSPSEVLQAADLGLSWVKLFPADAFGATYIRSLKEVLPLKLLATGGVSLATLPTYLEAGADGFGIGSPLFAPDQVRARNWAWLEERCRAFVGACSK